MTRMTHDHIAASPAKLLSAKSPPGFNGPCEFCRRHLCAMWTMLIAASTKLLYISVRPNLGIGGKFERSVIVIRVGVNFEERRRKFARKKWRFENNLRNFLGLICYLNGLRSMGDLTRSAHFRCEKRLLIEFLKRTSPVKIKLNVVESSYNTKRFYKKFHRSIMNTNMRYTLSHVL